MSYKIKNAWKEDSLIKITVAFNELTEGSVSFSDNTTSAEILSRLDEMEANYQSATQQRDALPEDLKILVGYEKP